MGSSAIKNTCACTTRNLFELLRSSLFNHTKCKNGNSIKNNKLCVDKDTNNAVKENTNLVKERWFINSSQPKKKRKYDSEYEKQIREIRAWFTGASRKIKTSNPKNCARELKTERRILKTNTPAKKKSTKVATCIDQSPKKRTNVSTAVKRGLPPISLRSALSSMNPDSKYAQSSQ